MLSIHCSPIRTYRYTNARVPQQNQLVSMHRNSNVYIASCEQEGFHYSLS